MAEIAFRGDITDEVSRDIRSLYLEGSIWVRAFILLVGIAALLVAAFPGETAAATFRIPPAQQQPLGPNTWLALVGMGVFSIAYGTVWAPAGYRRWWPRLTRQTGPRLSGTMSEAGLRWGTAPEPIAWRLFQSVKVSDRALLLYLTRSYPLPIHRALFASDAEWDRARGLVEGSGVPIRRT